MLRLISLFIFFITGWKVVGDLPKGVKKAVMTAAPHTSNWDFLYTRCAFYIKRIPVRYTIKKELLKFPLNLVLGPMGAISIDRSSSQGKLSMVDAMVKLFDSRDGLIVLVTPEGTRKYVENWKTGFYHVADKAGVPIVLGYCDYKKKQAGIGPVFETTGNVESDIEQIKGFYRRVTAKYPGKGVR